MEGVDIFLNDKYLVLEFLSNSIVNIGDEEYIPLSQNEIAKIMSFSIMKINSIMIKLKENKYIDMYHNTKGKYIVTSEGRNIVNKINAIKEKQR